MLKVCELSIDRPGGWQGYFHFTVAQGEWVTLIGPSGAGKSSLLEALAGFLSPRAGEILYGGQSLLQLAPHKRHMAYMFQGNSLFPHLKVKKNLYLAMHDQKLSPKVKEEKMGTLLEAFHLSTSFLTRYPYEVSGGELARLNLCAALLREKEMLLLDEPFASLDRETRRCCLNLLQKIHQQRKMLILSVTHHEDDAQLTADKIYTVEAGRVTHERNRTFKGCTISELSTKYGCKDIK